MILLALLSLLSSPADSHFFNSPKKHLSDSLKVKCDALLYRSTYVEYGCFFAINDKIEYSNAAEQCSEILAGSKVASKVPSSIFESIMVKKSDFHAGSNSNGAKNVMCVYDNDYKCDAGHALTSGRCIFRATKKMNFVDADNYCVDIGMRIPAPANNMDNTIIRDALVKDPVWVQKSSVRDNGFKWKQEKDFTKFTTCEGPLDQNPKLYKGSHKGSCDNDMASVIDGRGYWSNSGTQNLLEVICMKNAKNSFMAGTTTCKSYHVTEEQTASQSGGLQTASAPLSGDMSGKTCYTPLRTTSRNAIIGRATVETQRACEVRCDAKSECSGFSFKDAGFSSSCVLLSAETTNEQCTDTITIYQKKTSGCVARTNITAEFGVDPCIDEIVPSAFRGVDTATVCIQDKNKNYIIRAVDVDGNRITLFNDWVARITQSNGMWKYAYIWQHYSYVKHIVAVVCATAGGVKCPCKPLPTFPLPSGRQFASTQEVVNPCSRPAWLHYQLAKEVQPIYHGWQDPEGTAGAHVRCKAGKWMMFRQKEGDSWAVSALSCDA